MSGLSVVVLTWNRPAAMLNNSLWTLSNQTVPPSEIIVVEASPGEAEHERTRALCAEYPLTRLVETWWMKFNYSRGINVGIKRAKEEWIMATCMEMLFANDFIEVLSRLVMRERVVSATCGTLPEQVQIFSPSEARAQWPALCRQVKPYPPLAWSPGAMTCAHREWWYTVRGFDEARRPYSYPDVDIRDRAQRSGMETYNIAWDETQCIHPYHPPSALFYSVSGHPVDAQGVDRDVMRNDPEMWGEP